MINNNTYNIIIRLKYNIHFNVFCIHFADIINNIYKTIVQKREITRF